MEERKSTVRLNNAVKVVERYIIKTLIGLMSLLLIIATVQLGYMVIKSILESDVFILDLNVLMDLFGVFLLVLIGIELLDTIKVYFKKHDIHVEVVMLVALIAIARKIILLDFDKYSGLEVLGIASIVIALSLGYYFIKKAGGCGFWPRDRKTVKDVVIEETEFDDDGKTRIAERKKTLKEKNTEEQVEPDIRSKYSGPKDAIIERKIQSEKDSKDKK
ncbi:MAG: phosphate-starvation-inducible PsiE family protein [Bacteroidales bacterium]|nr:phosphate-starvation-inducible PsiE family protein [Bacteroidales bacterium]